MNHEDSRPNINKYLAQVRNVTLKSLVELKEQGITFDEHFEATFLRMTNESVAQTFKDFRNDNQQDLRDTTSNSQSELHDYDQEAYGRNIDVDFETNDDSKPSSISYVICFYCKSKIDRDKYMLHVREHLNSICCLECGQQIGTLADVFLHDEKVHGINRIEYHCSEFVAQTKKALRNSKVMFNNGLVVYYLDLIDTEHDESNTHSTFVQVLVDLEMAKYRALCQPKDLDDESKSDVVPVVVKQSKVDSNDRALQSIENQPSVQSHPNSYDIELQAQRKNINNMIIKGIPKMKKENLTGIFMTLCKKLNVELKADDILSIERCESRRDNIIVKLKNHKDKVAIRTLVKGRGEDLWSCDLVKLQPDVAKTKVYVYSQMTPFINNILTIARSACANGLLHSYQLSKDGVCVKRTAESADHIVLSKEQLNNYIKNCK